MASSGSREVATGERDQLSKKVNMVKPSFQYRYKKQKAPTLQNWKEPDKRFNQYENNSIIDCGWGKLLFGQTFSDHKDLVKELLSEKSGQRDIAFYIQDPHVVLSEAPGLLFLDPSHTFRIWFENYRPSKRVHRNLHIRRVQFERDVDEINRILQARNMVPIRPEFLWERRRSRTLFPLVAEGGVQQEIIGTVIGVDHHLAFQDIENGSSLWSLAVDPSCNIPGVGESLVRYLIEYFQVRGRSFLDLSVMHENTQAIKLYEKLNFERVPVFAIKRKNIFNEPLYTEPQQEEERLNPFAKIIVDEGKRRGLQVEIIDADKAFFKLSSSTRTVNCRESLTDYTSAIAMLKCADKALTHQLVAEQGVRVPELSVSLEKEPLRQFLRRHEKVVIKPADGEQGNDVYVEIDDLQDLLEKKEKLTSKYENIIVESFVTGFDVRLIVINYEFVAAAVRRPPEVVGNGQDTILRLVEKQSRRRQAATGGESVIPIDNELERCLREQDLSLTDVLPQGKHIVVRKAANVHQGGTIKDITNKIHPVVKQAAENAAKALEVPVVGLDFIMPDLDGSKYHMIEANERPGLANHEPQPVVEKFLDFLFPETVSVQMSHRN